MASRNRFDKAYQIDSDEKRGICLIINATNKASHGDTIRMQNLYEDDLNFIVKVSNVRTNKDIKQEAEKYARIDHTNFCCFVGVIFAPVNEEGKICCESVCESPIDLDSVLKPFCENNTLRNKPKVFLLHKYQADSSGLNESGQNEQILVNSEKKENKETNDLADVLVWSVTTSSLESSNSLTSFYREYVRITRSKANLIPVYAILKEAREIHECYSTQQTTCTAQFQVFDKLSHDLHIPFKKVPVIQRQITYDNVVDPNAIYPMDSAIKGYCIIINNLGSDFEYDSRLLEEVFQNDLGFHAEVYSDLSALAINELFEAVASVDHSHYSCLAVIMFVCGDESSIQGCDDKSLSISPIIEDRFSYSGCPTLSSKPKFFLYDIKFKPNPKPSRKHQSRRSSYHRIDEGEPDPTPKIIKPPPDTYRIMHTASAGKFSIDFANAVRRAREGRNTLNHICNSIREEHQLLQPFLGRQLKLIIKEPEDCNEQQKIRAAHFQMAIEIWDKIRSKTIELLKLKSENLLKVSKDVRIARSVGAGAGIAGGIATAAGFVLLPFTAGISLLLSVGGAAVATAGAVTSVGASVVGSIIEKSGLKEAMQVISLDTQLSQIMVTLLRLLEEEAERLALENPGTSKEDWLLGILRTGEAVLRVTSVGIKGTVIVAQAAGSAILEGGAVAARIAAGILPGVAVAGGVLSVLLLPISVIDLSVNVHALATDKKTKAVDELEYIINELEKNRKIVKDYIRRDDE